MNKFFTITAAALIALATTDQVSAAVVDSGAIESDGTLSTIDHWYFTVDTGGSIQIDVTSLSNDPEMNLWTANGTNTGLGTFIENDDDGGPGVDSRIIRTLVAGDYVLLVGLFSLPNGVTGFTNTDSEPPSSPYDLLINGDTSLNFVREGNLDGSFTQSEAISPVPLPAGLPLLIGGIGALGALRLKRKRAA